MGYLYLLLTIVTETTAVICMKFSNGFQYKIASLFAVFGYACSFIFSTLALKFLNAGIANAVWAGASTLLVALLGMYFFHERLSLLQLISLLFIVIGLTGIGIAGFKT